MKARDEYPIVVFVDGTKMTTAKDAKGEPSTVGMTDFGGFAFVNSEGERVMAPHSSILYVLSVDRLSEMN